MPQWASDVINAYESGANRSRQRQHDALNIQKARRDQMSAETKAKRDAEKHAILQQRQQQAMAQQQQVMAQKKQAKRQNFTRIGLAALEQAPTPEAKEQTYQMLRQRGAQEQIFQPGELPESFSEFAAQQTGAPQPAGGPIARKMQTLPQATERIEEASIQAQIRASPKAGDYTTDFKEAAGTLGYDTPSEYPRAAADKRMQPLLAEMREAQVEGKRKGKGLSVTVKTGEDLGTKSVNDLQTNYIEIGHMLDSIDEMKEFGTEFFGLEGLGKKLVGGMATYVGLAPDSVKEWVKQKQSLSTIAGLYFMEILHEFSGAQVSENERKAVKKVAGDPDSMSFEQFQMAISAMEKMARIKQRSIGATLKSKKINLGGIEKPGIATRADKLTDIADRKDRGDITEEQAKKEYKALK